MTIWSADSTIFQFGVIFKLYKLFVLFASRSPFLFWVCCWHQISIYFIFSKYSEVCQAFPLYLCVFNQISTKLNDKICVFLPRRALQKSFTQSVFLPPFPKSRLSALFPVWPSYSSSLNVSLTVNLFTQKGTLLWQLLCYNMQIYYKMYLKFFASAPTVLSEGGFSPSDFSHAQSTNSWCLIGVFFTSNQVMFKGRGAGLNIAKWTSN